MKTRLTRLLAIAALAACLGWADRASAAVIARTFSPALGLNTKGFLGEMGPGFTYEDRRYTFDWIPSSLAVDLDGNGTTDVTLISEPTYNALSASATGGSRIWGRAGGVEGRDLGSIAAALVGGAWIGPELNSPDPSVGWHNDDTTLAPSTLASTLDGRLGPGEFVSNDPDTLSYLGVRFERNGATHYGWIALNGYSHVGHELFVYGWAYESEPGVGLIAGQIPEPSLVILLGFGWAWHAGGRRRGGRTSLTERPNS